jgi:hypothetical protein
MAHGSRFAALVALLAASGFCNAEDMISALSGY